MTPLYFTQQLSHPFALLQKDLNEPFVLTQSQGTQQTIARPLRFTTRLPGDGKPTQSINLAAHPPLTFSQLNQMIEDGDHFAAASLSNPDLSEGKILEFVVIPRLPMQRQLHLLEPVFRLWHIVFCQCDAGFDRPPAADPDS